ASGVGCRGDSVMLDRKTGLGAKGKTFLSEYRRLRPPILDPSASAPDRGGHTAPPATDRRRARARGGWPADPIHHRGTEAQRYTETTTNCLFAPCTSVPPCLCGESDLK